jgi:hypothetical protein
MSDNLLDDLLSGGGKTFFGKGDQPGRSVTGTVTAVSVRQVTSFDTGKPEFWDDGQPKRQAVITLATAERDPADGDDDGSRNVYVKMWGDQRRALARVGTPAVGDTLTVTYTGDAPPAVKGFNGERRYEFALTRATPLTEALGTTGGAPATPSAPVPAPAAPSAASGPDTSKVPALRAAGLSDEQIAGATGLSLADVKGAA